MDFTDLLTSKKQDKDKDLLASIESVEVNFINLIRNRLGLVIHHHQAKELQKTILSACHQFNCGPNEYLQMLTQCNVDSPLLEHLVVGVTVGETYFFRDKNQMQLLSEKVLPSMIKRKRRENNLSLRIWSAGCATGEEIYTIAMMLSEMLPDINGWTLNLMGTDINTKGLQKAMLGQYGEWAMRSITSHYLKKYFTHSDNKYTLDQKIKDLVSFAYLNLNDDTYPGIFNGTNAQDLILCRNVLIYFESSRVPRLMQKFSASLVDEGYLLLGASDPIDTTGTDLVFHYRDGMLFTRPTLQPIQHAVPVKTPKKMIFNAKPVALQSLPPKMLFDEKQVHDFLEAGKWIEVLDHVAKTNEKSAFAFYAKASALANLGKLDEAKEACSHSLKLDSTNKLNYFTMGVILMELNDLEGAETALRKTLFLDRHFVIAHFQLGLLLLRKKQHNAGVKSLGNALEIVKKYEPMQPVKGFSHLTYGRLSEILEQEISLYSIAT